MNKEKKIMDDKYKLYDEICAKLLQNIEIEDVRDGGIYVSGYKDNYPSKVYMKMVESYSDLTNSQITMIMPLFPYLKFKFVNRKNRKRYHWIWADRLSTPIDEIIKFVTDYYEQSMDIYEDIYNAYYK